MNVDLARIQFAFTSINHFFFVPVTIGLAFLTALLQTAWHRSRMAEYLRLTRFFGPLWDGNEVWLIVAGAAMFAAFPGWYRGKRDAARWRRTWDGALTVGSVLAPLLIGIALGDLLHGLPIDSAQNYTGSFWDLLQPYAVFTGVTLVLVCMLHGATFLCLKTTDSVHERSRLTARQVAPVTCAFVIGFIIWTHVTASTTFFLNGFAFAATAVTTASCIITLFVDLYPNVMGSSTNPAYNLTVHNTASAPYSLKAMTIVVIVFLPLVIAYQAWTYHVFRRRVSARTRPPPRRSRC